MKTVGVGGERADDLFDAPAVISLDPKWRVGTADRQLLVTRGRLGLKIVKSGPTVAA